jgi:hypothetical protein
MKIAVVKRNVVAAAALAAAMFSFTPVATAEGAFALGSSGDVAKDGVSYGYSTNHPTTSEAVENAMKECRVGKNAPKMAAICKLVTTFKNECIAVAWDPKPGTPGMGVAFAPDKPNAEARAMELCKMSAGTDRQGACVVDKSRCDGTGN